MKKKKKNELLYSISFATHILIWVGCFITLYGHYLTKEPKFITWGLIMYGMTFVSRPKKDED